MGAAIEMTNMVMAVPPRDIWMTDDSAAKYLEYKTEYFQQSIACLPGFPKPRIINGRRRWNLKELSDWVNVQTGEDKRKIGRPRRI